MRLKKFFNTLSILLMFALVSFGQNEIKPDKERLKNDPMIEKLNLSDDQQTKMAEMRSAHMEKIQGIIRNQELDRDAKMEAVEKERAQFKEDLSTILSPEQLEQFEEIHENRRKGAFIDRMIHKEKRKEAMKARKSKMKERKEQMGQAMKEMKAYKEENILPVMKEQRLKLEAQLSEEDKLVIQDIREKAKDKKEKAKLKKKEWMEKRKDNKVKKERPRLDPEKKEEWREKMKEKKEAMKKKREAHMLEFEGERALVRSLLEKYENSIDELFQEIEDDRAQWREDMQRIKEKHLKESEGERGRRSMIKRKRQKGERKQGDRVGFLLMEVSEKAMVEERIAEIAGVKGFNVYPNPAKSFNTLEIDLAVSGTVQIGLYEESGKLVKTILNEYMEAGSHEMTVNVDDLNPGYYIYTIKTKDGVRSEKMTIAY